MEKWPNKRSQMGYCAISVTLSALTILTALSLLLVLFPASKRVTEMAQQLQQIIRPEAISTTISAIGVAGVVFGWLISRMEDRIYGARLADLVEAIYPHFFRGYVRKFIFSALIGIYSGKANLFWPAFYAFWEVLLHLVLLIRVCYVFVIRSDYRENLAFFCYEKEIFRAKDESSVRSVLLNTADYTHMLISREHRYGKLEKMVNLWECGLKKVICDNSALEGEQGISPYTREMTWDRATEGYWKKKNDGMMKGIALSKCVWETFLRGESEAGTRVEIVAPLLRTIRSDVCDPVQFCILIGLAQALFGFYMDHEEGVVLEMRKLLDDVRQDVAQNLTLILTIILLIYRLQNRKDAEKALYRVYIHMRSEIDSIVLMNKADDVMMLYTEWSARELLRIDMVQYMLRISDELVDDEMRKRKFFNVGEKGYHLKMLVYFLNSVQYMAAVKTK